MAYITGIADSLKHMQQIIKMHACGYPFPQPNVQTGSGVGLLEDFSTDINAVVENWTLTCTVPTAAPVIIPHGINLGAESGVFIDDGLGEGEHDPLIDQSLELHIGLPFEGWLQYDTRPPFLARNNTISGSGDWIFSGSYANATEELPDIFYGGHTGVASVQQIDFAADGVSTADIDNQAVVFHCQAYRNNFDNFGGGDVGLMEFHFLDAAMEEIVMRVQEPFTLIDGWLPDDTRYVLPVGCRYVDVVMVGELADGAEVNVYFDDLTIETESYAGRFSISGSSSGGIGTAAIHGYQQFFPTQGISLKLTDPGITFVGGDQFTVACTAGALAGGLETWVAHRDQWFTNYDRLGAEILLEGPGASGNDAIFVGVRTYSVGTSLHNLVLGGFTGFDDTYLFHGQPGGIPQDDGDFLPEVSLHDTPMEYWLCVSGRRIMGVIKVGAVYEHIYLGFLKPYYTPTQYPYPLAIGGSNIDTSYNIPHAGDPTIYHRAYWNCSLEKFHDRSSTLRFRKHDGAWKSFANMIQDIQEENGLYPFSTETGVFPWTWSSIRGLGANLDGSIPMFPAILHEDDNDGGTALHGEFDGLYAVPGKPAVVEDTITVGEDVYMIFQNCGSSDDDAYCAMKLI
jgi:hypothetical protein